MFALVAICPSYVNYIHMYAYYTVPPGRVRFFQQIIKFTCTSRYLKRGSVPSRCTLGSAALCEVFFF
jgi:hypothetical protein